MSITKYIQNIKELACTYYSPQYLDEESEESVTGQLVFNIAGSEVTVSGDYRVLLNIHNAWDKLTLVDMD